MWQTHITVAAIIEHQAKFLLVTDNTSSGHKLNQPAGHVEPQEDIIAAVIREVKEETSLDFTPKKIVGIYWYHPNPEQSYLRVCFSGQVSDLSVQPQARLNDDDVIAVNWYQLNEIIARQKEHRSSLVLRCINDYLAGNEFPLALLANCHESAAIQLD